MSALAFWLGLALPFPLGAGVPVVEALVPVLGAVARWAAG